MSNEADKLQRRVTRGLGKLYPVEGRRITIPAAYGISVEQAKMSSVDTLEVPRAFMAELITTIHRHKMTNCPDWVFSLAKNLAETEVVIDAESPEDFADDIEASDLVADIGGPEKIEELLNQGLSNTAIAEKLGLPLHIVIEYERYSW